MKEVDKAIEILQAYKEGKEIEYYINGEWKPVNGERILLKLMYHECRIKPIKRWRPYKSSEEFINEQKIHGPHLYYVEEAKACGGYYCPYVIKDSGVYSGYGVFRTYSSLLDSCTWQDGHRCGILEGTD